MVNRAVARRSIVPTKHLVAHRPDVGAAFEAGSALAYGPDDGEAVDLPAPCDRLRAGFWCSCGGSFISAATWEVVHFARVVALGGGDAPRYIDDRENGYEWPVPGSTGQDREALLACVEALPIGTVVERHGLTLAPRFDPSSRGPARPAPGEAELTPF